VASLREEITIILTVARPADEVVLRLESGGGLVHAYGLAASQLTRIKDKQIRLTIAVDKIAASGGYLMACVADHIIAAPFAVVGSIGVLAQLPNFNRFLKRHDIDFEQFTAGEFKRTVTLFGENTDEDRARFRQEIDETHRLFKAFVKTHRDLDMATVATGEHWYGTRALELKLVDELCTSDDYLLHASKTAELYQVSFRPKKPFIDRLSSLASILDKGFMGRYRMTPQHEQSESAHPFRRTLGTGRHHRHFRPYIAGEVLVTSEPPTVTSRSRNGRHVGTQVGATTNLRHSGSSLPVLPVPAQQRGEETPLQHLIAIFGQGHCSGKTDRIRAIESGIEEGSHKTQQVGVPLGAVLSQASPDHSLPVATPQHSPVVRGEQNLVHSSALTVKQAQPGGAVAIHGLGDGHALHFPPILITPQ